VIRHYDEPEVATIDKSGANTAALITLNADKPEYQTANPTRVGSSVINYIESFFYRGLMLR
jgi:hypothetical protein